ncbi:unnamed protein product [Didymodactylos carnosus]|uniref:Uncharacterized protein n=1 Tax=Didymodactylos carnosus TaxID=1234261 RepID=A0A815SNR6_9BILA|nr:unnamed protein product [Didymodactylos carnosus]CAF1493987.1 unnamed protein product [Didymodactylos carnosus]CAF4084955.1 unnamed protein product [Didymodactylos carnosus]CAF4356695.1 unnamed protein product [Didymodactylos carnosus]
MPSTKRKPKRRNKMWGSRQLSTSDSPESIFVGLCEIVEEKVHPVLVTLQEGGGRRKCILNSLDVQWDTLKDKLMNLYHTNRKYQLTSYLSYSLYDYKLQPLEIKRYKSLIDYMIDTRVTLQSTVIYLCRSNPVVVDDYNTTVKTEPIEIRNQQPLCHVSVKYRRSSSPTGSVVNEILEKFSEPLDIGTITSCNLPSSLSLSQLKENVLSVNLSPLTGIIKNDYVQETDPVSYSSTNDYFTQLVSESNHRLTTTMMSSTLLSNPWSMSTESSIKRESLMDVQDMVNKYCSPSSLTIPLIQGVQTKTEYIPTQTFPREISMDVENKRQILIEILD